MSKLLIEEPPFQVLPTLARLTSLNEAVALQQLHFEMDRSPHLKHGDDGVLRRWVGYTQAQWKEVFKHIWSKKTIQRIFEALVSQQLTLLEQFGKHRGDMTNWYSVDYDALERLVAKTHKDNLSSCPADAAAKPGQPGLFDPTQKDKLSSCSGGQLVLLFF